MSSEEDRFFTTLKKLLRGEVLGEQVPHRTEVRRIWIRAKPGRC